MVTSACVTTFRVGTQAGALGSETILFEAASPTRHFPCLAISTILQRVVTLTYRPLLFASAHGCRDSPFKTAIYTSARNITLDDLTLACRELHGGLAR